MTYTTSMIDFEEALDLALSHARLLSTEEVMVQDLLGRSIAEPIRSPHDLPLFDNSAVDGYAIASGDIEAGIEKKAFQVVAEIAAGSELSIELSLGQVARVFTGARLPIGTGGVAMQEIADELDGVVRFREGIEVGDFCRRRGDELKRGDELVSRGRANPATIGALAGAGIASAVAYRQPRVGLLVTGDELANADAELRPGQIFEANGPMLSAAIESMGFCQPELVRCSDELGATKAALSELLGRCDVVITSGGVSVGTRDVLRPAFDQLGVRYVFWSVAIKPGKPLFFGSTERCAVFGLPGNPVSALTTFLLFVRPFLRAISGLPSASSRRSMKLLSDLTKKSGRAEFVPGRILPEGVSPITGRASHKLSNLVAADCLIVLGKQVEFQAVGSLVEVTDLAWN